MPSVGGGKRYKIAVFLGKIPRRLAFHVSAKHIDPCNLLFDFYCIVADPALWPNEKLDPTARTGPAGMRLVTLKAVSGPGDDGEPVMTFMLPDED